jgi:hypothetical protein
MTIKFPPDVIPPRDLGRPMRELALLHPLAQTRWEEMRPKLEAALGCGMFVNETWRPNERQLWLYGAGRTVDQCRKMGVPSKYARPAEKIVTNSWNSTNSAHGWLLVDESGKLTPAACALDVAPLGRDQKPWTKDDPWEQFYQSVTELSSIGLVHFHKPGKRPWDMPHLQLTEWSDAKKRLLLETK